MKRKNVIGLISLLGISVLTACTPSKQYAGSKNDGAFFAVPNGWHQISTKALNKEEGSTNDQSDLDRLAMVTYQVGYSSQRGITARDVFMLKPTDNPVVFARFRDLFPEERNAISLNALRDVVLPVTQYLDGSTENDRNFMLIDDKEINEKGGKGVNLVFSFDYNGINQTVNQTSVFSNDQSKIYIFVVRCSTECYNKNSKIIDSIVNSFTVRGAR